MCFVLRMENAPECSSGEQVFSGTIVGHLDEANRLRHKYVALPRKVIEFSSASCSLVGIVLINARFAERMISTRASVPVLVSGVSIESILRRNSREQDAESRNRTRR